MSRRLLTAWLMLVRLVLKETLVPSGRASSRMSNDPRARIIGDFAAVIGGVAVGGGGVIRMAIPSSARPGRSRFACPAEPACRTDAPAFCQPRVEVAVELGAVGECDRGHHAGEHDREHGEGGEDDASAERAGLHSGSSR